MFLKIVLVSLLTFGEISCFLRKGSPDNICCRNYKDVCVYKPGVKQHSELLLAVHGLGESFSTWNSVEDVILSYTGRKMIAPDLRNHGYSCYTNISDVATMASDLEKFLDNHQIPKVNVMGNSWGGKVALHFVLNNPHRVNSLIVEDFRPNGITDKALQSFKQLVEGLGPLIPQIPENINEEQAKKFLIKAFTEKAGMESEDANDQIKALPMNCLSGKCKVLINYDAILNAVNHPVQALTHSSGKYNGPTLFIYGTKSPFKVGDVKDEILQQFPNAKIVPVEGASHIFHGKFPQFSNEVINFLNNVP